MRLLLDTHTLAWWLLDSPRLSPTAKLLLEDAGNEIFASAISAYEATYKHRIGKWPEIGPLVVAFEKILASQDFRLLSITGRHAALAAQFTVDHGDPFDRILAAQAEIDDLTLVTNDRWFDRFGTRVLW